MGRDEEYNLNTEFLYIIGIGGLGCNFCRFIIDRYQYNNILALTTDREGLKGLPEQQTILYGEQICNGKGCAGDVLLGEGAFGEVYGSLSKLFFIEERYTFIIAGLGGGTGTGAVRYLCTKLSKNAHHNVSLSLTTPFSFEDEHIQNISAEAIPLIEGSEVPFTLFNNNDILQGRPKEDPVKDALQDGLIKIADTIFAGIDDK